MTETQANEMVKLLSLEFGVKPPRIHWGRLRSGMYRWSNSTIYISPTAWRGVEVCLIHEFAHHLARNRQMGTFRVKKIMPHGEEFFAALVDTVKVWYTDPLRYEWNTEYPRIFLKSIRWLGVPGRPIKKGAK